LNEILLTAVVWKISQILETNFSQNNHLCAQKINQHNPYLEIKNYNIHHQHSFSDAHYRYYSSELPSCHLQHWQATFHLKKSDNK